MKRDIFDISGRAYLITGATGGLGRSLALGLAERGAKVALLARSRDEVEQLAGEIRSQSGDALACAADACIEEQTAAAFQSAADRFGHLDGVVISHGLSIHGTALNIGIGTARTLLETNVVSAFACARAFARQAVAQGRPGSVVFLSSSAAQLAFDGLSIYGPCKAAIDQMIRQLSYEWGSHRLRVNGVSPGYMSSHMKGTVGAYENVDVKRSVSVTIPLGRWGEPDELLGAVILLLSDASSYMTGQVLTVDGGYAAR